MAVGALDSVLGGRYRVKRVLGSGGMATVFLCTDERLGRSVAVKRLHAHSPEETAQRFVREAKLGASLNHPNLVSVYDTVTDDEGVLIVMELVEGENLATALRRGPLPTGDALAVIRDVAGGLDHAHGHGVVHRDIKPANVLLREDGVTKLVDLGIATAADQTKITRSGIVLGTAAYMAPEQLDGSPTGPATDIYALSVVAYEALSGKRARSGRTPIEIAHQVATEGPPDLKEVWSEAPPEAAAVLCRGMAQDPEQRPASAGELAEELENALKDVDDTRPTRRATRTGLAGGAAAGAAAAAAGAGAAEAAEPPAEAAAAAPVEESQPTPTPRRETDPPRREPDPPRREPEPPRREPPIRTFGGKPAERSGPSRGLIAGLAALALAIAAVVLVAALSSGGSDNTPASSSTPTKQKTTAQKPKQKSTSQAQATAPSQTTPAPTSNTPGNPAEGARLDAQGFQLIQQGKYADAVPIERRAVASFPSGDTSANYAYALFNLGTALNRSGHPQEAIPYLRKRLSFSNDRRAVVEKELQSAQNSAG
jgi:serine/threonine-protein kinase